MTEKTPPPHYRLPLSFDLMDCTQHHEVLSDAAKRNGKNITELILERFVHFPIGKRIHVAQLKGLRAGHKTSESSRYTGQASQHFLKILEAEIWNGLMAKGIQTVKGVSPLLKSDKKIDLYVEVREEHHPEAHSTDFHVHIEKTDPSEGVSYVVRSAFRKLFG